MCLYIHILSSRLNNDIKLSHPKMTGEKNDLTQFYTFVRMFYKNRNV